MLIVISVTTTNKKHNEIKVIMIVKNKTFRQKIRRQTKHIKIIISYKDTKHPQVNISKMKYVPGHLLIYPKLNKIVTVNSLASIVVQDV
jgi:hypothetical protein